MAISEVPRQEFPDVVGAVPEDTRAAAFRPFIPAEVRLRELTPVPLIVGTILGIIFGASSLYLVLKVGLTVSASIPVAVISLTVFRLLGKMGLRGATILENNIVQTAGSAGESIAFGVGVTMPAIMILGFDLEITRVMLVAVLGGLLGILMMIPLRRALIVQQHGILKYPEGTACAEVLKAGATPEEWAIATRAATAAGDAPAADQASQSGAKTIFTGFGIGFAYQVAMMVFKGWKDVPEKVFGAALPGRLDRGRDLARAARRRLHHRPPHRLHHVRGRRAGLPGAHPGDQPSSARRPPASWRPAPSPSPRWGRTRSAAPTCSTSAPARWPRAASSACSARSPRSGTA